VVLMGLKGADPKLEQGLINLLSQNYPDYELHVCVDSREDPAWSVVEAAIARTGAKNVRVKVFDIQASYNHLNTLNAKLVQLLGDLDDSFEVICTVDGDTLVHPDFLRELVLPFSMDSTIGATFGNRWFMPSGDALGSLVRYVWNCASTVVMFLVGIPWGGALAIHNSAAGKTLLAKRLERRLVHDSYIPEILREKGKRLVFVPSLMLKNSESCDMRFAINFIKRQLLWTRLNSSKWFLLLMVIIIVTSILMLAFILALIAAAVGDLPASQLLLGSIVIALTLLLVQLALVEHAVRISIAAQGPSTRWLTPNKALKIPLALIVAFPVNLVATLQAAFARTIDWRGETLRLGRDNVVRMVRNTPVTARDDNYSL
jgi:hypothetical protein